MNANKYRIRGPHYFVDKNGERNKNHGDESGDDDTDKSTVKGVDMSEVCFRCGSADWASYFEQIYGGLGVEVNLDDKMVECVACRLSVRAGCLNDFLALGERLLGTKVFNFRPGPSPAVNVLINDAERAMYRLRSGDIIM